MNVGSGVTSTLLVCAEMGGHNSPVRALAISNDLLLKRLQTAAQIDNHEQEPHDAKERRNNTNNNRHISVCHGHAPDFSNGTR